MAEQNEIDSVKLYGELVTAFNQKAWQRVQLLSTSLLPVMPGDAGLHYIAGVAHMQMKQMRQAVENLEKATELEPQRADFATQYAKSLAITRLARQARAAADRALALLPDDPFTLDTLGVVYSQINAFEQAVAVFRRLVALAPNHAAFRFNLAYSLITVGENEAAEHELEATIRLDARYWRAHLTLAQLRKWNSSDNHLDRMQSLLPQYPYDSGAQLYLNMSLAKEYEDTGEHFKAFVHLIRGNLAGANRRYSIRQDESLFTAISESFKETQTQIGGYFTHEPIFIIGMPRSGTTLVERVLSSHPDVQSAGELLNFGIALKHASRSRTPALIDVDTVIKSRLVDMQRLGESYLESTRSVSGQRPRFIDKLPHNFLYAGFIASALPNAKIICLRRNPLDTCLGNFRHLFEQGSSFYDYSFDLLNTGRYYVLFNQLMAHWQNVFPGRILEINYEKLVESQEAGTRELLAFCGLAWDDACLNFEKNKTPVNTPNAWQVRSPIYRSALKRWKEYEGQIGELKTLLHQAGIEFGE